MFMDMSIHDFDMARYLLAEEPREIYTMAGVMVDPEIGNAGDVDTALTLLRFPSGALAVIDNSRRASYGYDQRVEVLGDRGKIETMNCFPNQAIVSDGQSVRRDLPLNFFMDRYTESFVEEMREFVAALREKRAPAVTGSDGRMAVVIALAARQSHLERRPVCIEEIGAR
jgi:myo-inositol 2-dehydrogenase/D-chiro-inositol 1-dehydrogenase